jgi:hypothetical protein
MKLLKLCLIATCTLMSAAAPASAIQHRYLKCQCVSPTLYRGADSADYVCVTPASHNLIIQENAQASNLRVSAADNHCKSGFVWRDAFDGDGVCVSPAARDRVHNENAHWGANVDSVDASPACANGTK